MKEETAEAIQRLYEKFIVDLSETTGTPCDVLVMVHPQHSEGECTGMSLHCNADPVQAHKLAFSGIMWAENTLNSEMNIPASKLN